MIEQLTAWVQLAAEVLIFAGVAYNTLQTCLTNRKLRAVHAKVESVEATTSDTNAKVVAVEAATNGMRKALVEASSKEGFARGQIVGAENERQRQKGDDGA